jgi:hypothetical protein
LRPYLWRMVSIRMILGPAIALALVAGTSSAWSQTGGLDVRQPGPSLRLEDRPIRPVEPLRVLPPNLTEKNAACGQVADARGLIGRRSADKRDRFMTRCLAE